MKTLSQILAEVEKEFEERFDDLTHVGCGGGIEFPCGSVKSELKSFLTSRITLAITEAFEAVNCEEEIKALLRTDETQMGSDHDYDEGVSDVQTLLSTKKKQFLTEK